MDVPTSEQTSAPICNGPDYGDARRTTRDDLKLVQYRKFGYWFDFGDDGYHLVQLERIEPAIPTVPYPRITKRFGKLPPHYPSE